MIPLRSAWVMTAVISTTGNLVACGGMDNQLTVYNLNEKGADGSAKIIRECLGYEGFLSSCKFLDDTELVTGISNVRLCIEREKGVPFNQALHMDTSGIT